MWRKREIEDRIRYDELKTECDAMLMGLLGRKELLDNWWNGQNLHFNLKTPIEVFNSNEAGRQSVHNYLSEHCYGGGGY